ncbi:MAG: hypothetical protein IJW36_00645 [Clostridia bacterium]|nr:hypothetical protein [Clostridia bacterium]
MKKLCVVFGGESSEHDISIITGMQLCKNFYMEELEKIYFGLDNKFYLATKVENLNFFEDKEKIKLTEVIFHDAAVYKKGLTLKKLFDVECVINCCHGGVGENGNLAGFFQVNKIKCTSANSLASHIAMDKSLAKELVRDIAPTVNGVKVTKSNFDIATKQIDETFSFELIVKPNSLGSSIGVKVCNIENYKDQIEAIFEMGDDALVEERVVNLEEYNQACFRSKDGLMLSAIEHPISKHDFLTFEDKYKTKSKAKGSDREIPAKISPELEEQIINYTSKIYEKLGMNGVVRIDYIFDKTTNTLYFNEINTIPGSMAFYLYEPLGIDYITLVENLIENAEDIKKFAYFNTQILKDKKI